MCTCLSDSVHIIYDKCQKVLSQDIRMNVVLCLLIMALMVLILMWLASRDDTKGGGGGLKIFIN